jgi:hypothetical protein
VHVRLGDKIMRPEEIEYLFGSRHLAAKRGGTLVGMGKHPFDHEGTLGAILL